MADPPTLANNVRLDPPFFLRKLRRQAHWGHAEMDRAQRRKEAVREVFLRDEKPYSLYRVETDEDFHWTVMGLNGGRPSLTIDSDFIAILPEEFAALAITPEASVGETLCRYANALHHDFHAEEQQLHDLCDRLMQQDRPVIHLTRGMLQPLKKKAELMNCLVIPGSPGCNHTRCASPA
jgi:hypothetical protein